MRNVNFTKEIMLYTFFIIKTVTNNIYLQQLNVGYFIIDLNHNYLFRSNSSRNFSFLTLIKVPFIPKDRDSITPALSSLRNAFTITERVIPTLSATFEAINRPSLPPNSSKICSIASFSE